MRAFLIFDDFILSLLVSCCHFVVPVVSNVVILFIFVAIYAHSNTTVPEEYRSSQNEHTTPGGSSFCVVANWLYNPHTCTQHDF